ncbi:MAG TPA: hydrophobe/amphiphile efflux-1 family RND transporter [Lentisphaeria bacterium]|nr:MAG: multidrug efflux RND transporter permease [Lentisphaerae bacterium GWF2_38_69]HBM17441.1 hydrophobe/amphiphile efflux-1 family RND transporter [Lentisphaeria bacterium]
MSHYFIERPVFAWVIALVLMLSGIVSIFTLPVSQYPAIAMPEITIEAVYPGASAKTIEDTVTQIIEQKMVGLDNLCYIASSSDAAGFATITLTFNSGTNPDIAQVQVQNKLQLAIPQLPQAVQLQGLSVSKSSASFLMVIGFVSEDESMDRNDLTDYVVGNVQEQLSRVQGVGEVLTFGSQYAMRIWLDPDKLNNFALTPSDVKDAVRSYNVEVSAGQLGANPSTAGQRLNATVNIQCLLQTPEEFGEIILKTNPDGSYVTLNEVARIELGSESYDTSAYYNGKPAAGMAVKLASGANALLTVKNIKTKLSELSEYFPSGMRIVYPYDTTPFVRIAVKEVIITFIEAIILVFLVMYLFLQNFRATLIPTIAVPVVLLGTFTVLNLTGFSINMLTMFAMVLAIGLLVDDAIVVVENVERLIKEEKLTPVEATKKSMNQITGALIGITMVLTAVFIPMAFFSGSTGVIYRQFSITMVSCMVLSVIVAIIFTPALCATILKSESRQKPKIHFLSSFFNIFNRIFNSLREKYLGAVSGILSRSIRYIIIYVLIAGGTAYIFMGLPSSYLPDEDQGILFTLFMLPPGSTQEQTLQVIKKAQNFFLEKEKDAVESFFGVAGFSFAGRGQNVGLAFIKLKDWSLRKSPELKIDAIAGMAMKEFSKIREAMVFVFPPPACIELGFANGFDLQLQDRASLGHEKLMDARNQLLGMASKNPNLMMVRPNGLDDTPELKIDINYRKAGALGIPITVIQDALSIALGSSYVNDFINRGRTKKVYLQADAQFRMVPEDLNKWYVKNNLGKMVPFSAFANTKWTYGSPRLERYNGFPSVEIMGEAAIGKTSGDAMKVMEQLVSKLPFGIGYEWTGLSYQEQMSGKLAPLLYFISLIIVFLCLAALYESWTIPFSIILIVPIGIFGAVLATSMMGLSNDIYFQVGLLTTIGLSAKNAILIVEFAKTKFEAGDGLIKATIDACYLRLRPILMTSFAFIFGVMPLALNKGAGSGAQNSIGVGVMGGMISATLLAIFFIPLFFVLIMKIFTRKTSLAKKESEV